MGVFNLEEYHKEYILKQFYTSLEISIYVKNVHIETRVSMWSINIKLGILFKILCNIVWKNPKSRIAHFHALKVKSLTFVIFAMKMGDSTFCVFSQKVCFEISYCCKIHI